MVLARRRKGAEERRGEVFAACAGIHIISSLSRAGANELASVSNFLPQPLVARPNRFNRVRNFARNPFVPVSLAPFSPLAAPSGKIAERHAVHPNGGDGPAAHRDVAPGGHSPTDASPAPDPTDSGGGISGILIAIIAIIILAAAGGGGYYALRQRGIIG